MSFEQIYKSITYSNYFYWSAKLLHFHYWSAQLLFYFTFIMVTQQSHNLFLFLGCCLFIQMIRLLLTCNHQTKRPFVKCNPNSNFSLEPMDSDGKVWKMTLNGETNYDNGWNHGHYMATYLWPLFLRVKLVSLFLPPIPKCNIPSDYSEELLGICDGFNESFYGSFFTMTYELLLKCHLLPETKLVSACTCAVSKNENGELLFARNMDWLPFGLGGSYSLWIEYPRTRIQFFGPPGCIGVVTGVNRSGLILAMNVCPGKVVNQVGGTPSVFVNRLLLEHCRSWKEVVQKVNDPSFAVQPIGPYHLTGADSSEEAAGRISFFQREAVYSSSKPMHLFFDFDDQRAVLYTLNENATTLEECFDVRGRQAIIKKMIEDKSNPSILSLFDFLREPKINSYNTIHSFLFFVKKQAVYVAQDNGFAAFQNYVLTNY